MQWADVDSLDSVATVFSVVIVLQFNLSTAFTAPAMFCTCLQRFVNHLLQQRTTNMFVCCMFLELRLKS